MDIQSEMRHSAAPAVTGTNITERDAGDISGSLEQDPGLSQSPSSSDADRPGEGSIRYRIAALVAMLLLAIVTLCIWYYGR